MFLFKTLTKILIFSYLHGIFAPVYAAPFEDFEGLSATTPLRYHFDRLEVALERIDAQKIIREQLVEVHEQSKSTLNLPLSTLKDLAQSLGELQQLRKEIQETLVEDAFTEEETATLQNEADQVIDIVAEADLEVEALHHEAREAKEVKKSKDQAQQEGPIPTLTYEELPGNGGAADLDAALNVAQQAVLVQKLAALEALSVSDFAADVLDVAKETVRESLETLRAQPFQTLGRVIGAVAYEVADLAIPGGADQSAAYFRGEQSFTEAAAWQAAGAGAEAVTGFVMGKIAKVGVKGGKILAHVAEKVAVKRAEKAASKGAATVTQKGVEKLAKERAGAKPPIKPYDVGEYGKMKKSVREPGLEMHHAPQQHPAKQVIPGYDPKTAPAIALSKEEHAQLPNIKGTYGKKSGENARSLLAKDVRNLRNRTDAPNKQILQLVEQAKAKYPESLNK